MKKQLIDQSAHLCVGAALVFVLGLAVPGWAAFCLMMTAAVFRECAQHDGFNFGRGTALDLAFFALGGALGWWL